MSMIGMLFKKYKPNLLQLLKNYCNDNKSNLTVNTVEESDKVTVTVVMNRTLFTSTSGYKEIMATLNQIGQVEKK